MSASSTDPRRKARQAKAEERKAARAARTPLEQLALLESRPGKSARERARLEGVTK